jgi:serine/threonine protein kinase
MELVGGPTLRQVLADKGALSPQRAVTMAAQVADALDYAHKAGIVHRDVKPANILLCDDRRVKVTDFGIAKAAVPEDVLSSHLGPDLTQSGAIIGTAKYLSPEQVNGEALDGRSDVYALGVVLYEMLCGRPPFVGETDLAIAMQHVSATPPRPRQVRAGIPRALESIVLRAMAKSPADRYATAAELQSALLSVRLEPDETAVQIVPEPSPPPEKAPTFAQSERSWMVPVVLIVVLAITLGIVGVLFARSETGRRLLDSDDSSQAAPLSIRRALAFDPPPGSRYEHDEELAHLHDGSPSTTWNTERYADNRFGGLKDGVGFVVEVGGAPLGTLEVESPTTGWSAQVFVADSPKPTTSQWGAAVDSATDVDGDATFDLGGRQGGAVLVWVTDLGEGNDSLAVGEVRVGE